MWLRGGVFQVVSWWKEVRLKEGVFGGFLLDSCVVIGVMELQVVRDKDKVISGNLIRSLFCVSYMGFIEIYGRRGVLGGKGVGKRG